jgi:hypothetical protein
VTGRLTLSWFFDWDGIILAGSLGDVGSFTAPSIEGMLIGGLGGANPDIRIRAGAYRYDSCKAYNANRSLSYLEVVPDALVEINR